MLSSFQMKSRKDVSEVVIFCHICRILSSLKESSCGMCEVTILTEKENPNEINFFASQFLKRHNSTSHASMDLIFFKCFRLCVPFAGSHHKWVNISIAPILGFFFAILKISIFNFFFLNMQWMSSERRIRGWSYTKPLPLGAWGLLSATIDFLSTSMEFLSTMKELQDTTMMESRYNTIFNGTAINGFLECGSRFTSWWVNLYLKKLFPKSNSYLHSPKCC